FFYSLSRRKTSLLSSFFPYTTLFRSHRPSFFNVENVVNLVRHDIIYSGGGIKTSNGVYFSNKKPVTWCSRIRPIFVLRLIHNRRDRKSTRLNSSHVSISYAVFCLKKK